MPGQSFLVSQQLAFLGLWCVVWSIFLLRLFLERLRLRLACGRDLGLILLPNLAALLSLLFDTFALLDLLEIFLRVLVLEMGACSAGRRPGVPTVQADRCSEVVWVLDVDVRLVLESHDVMAQLFEVTAGHDEREAGRACLLVLMAQRSWRCTLGHGIDRLAGLIHLRQRHQRLRNLRKRPSRCAQWAFSRTRPFHFWRLLAVWNSSRRRRLLRRRCRQVVHDE